MFFSFRKMESKPAVFTKNTEEMDVQTQTVIHGGEKQSESRLILLFDCLIFLV